jgi:hypothetical protein
VDGSAPRDGAVPDPDQPAAGLAALLPVDEDADEVVLVAAGFAASPEEELPEAEPPEVEPPEVAPPDAPEVDLAAPVVDDVLDRESFR